MTSHKTRHFKKRGNENLWKKCQNWKWPKGIPNELSRWRPRRWLVPPRQKFSTWLASRVRFPQDWRVSMKKSIDFNSILQYIWKKPNWSRFFQVRDPRKRMEAQGQKSHLNCPTTGRQLRTGVSGREHFSTGLRQLRFLWKVRDCHNPIVVLVLLGNSRIRASKLELPNPIYRVWVKSSRWSTRTITNPPASYSNHATLYLWTSFELNLHCYTSEVLEA